MVGCGPTVTEDEKQTALKSVEQAFTAWKKSVPQKKWNETENGLRCTDPDWLAGYQLVEYQLEGVEASDRNRPLTKAVLKVRRGKGPIQEKIVTYEVAEKDGVKTVYRYPEF